VLLNTVSSGYTASKVASRMIFDLDLRPKIIPPAPFSLSNPDDPAFNNSLLGSVKNKYCLNVLRLRHESAAPTLNRRAPLQTVFLSRTQA
jgi:hypothetical protein